MLEQWAPLTWSCFENCRGRQLHPIIWYSYPFLHAHMADPDLHLCQGIAPLLPPKPEAAPLPNGAADGAVENGDAANNAQIAERRRAAEMVALVRC